MPRDQSGQYTKPPGTTAIPNTTIASAPYNALQDDMADALTESLPRTGVAPMLADLPMNGNKITGLEDGADAGDAVNFGQLDDKLNKDGSNVGDATAQAAFRVAIGANLLGGFRNKLINALGTINQRGYVSGAATSGANQYTLDRWRVVTSGQSLSWTESENVRTMTAPAGGVEQVIEGESILSGDHVLNWEGDATATVDGNAVTKGEVFMLTGGADVTVRFVGGTFSKPQLEEGTSPTQFEVRHPQQELALCQRYYWHSQNTTGLGPLRSFIRSTTSQSRVATVYLPTTMRVAPTVSAAYEIEGGGSGSASVEFSSVDTITLTANTGNTTSIINFGDVVADAEI